MAAKGRLLTVHCEGPWLAERKLPGIAPHSATALTVWTSTLDELVPLSEKFLGTLDRTERERMKRFKFESDRQRFLLGHGYLRSILGGYYDLHPAEVRIERGPFGKPFVQGTNTVFNLSDTKDAVAIAVGSDMDLGVDVETVSRTVDHLAVGEHYFSIEEQGSIVGSADGKRRFLELWTRKEAVLKASGVGIMDDLRILRVDQDVNEMTITHEAFVEMAAPAYYVRTWHVGKDHILSLASSKEFGNVQLLHAR